MTVVKILSKIFNVKIRFSIKERYDKAIFSFRSSPVETLNEDLISKLITKLNLGNNSWFLNIYEEHNDEPVLQLDSVSDVERFCLDYHEMNFQDEDILKITLQIEKSCDDGINYIYDLSSFGVWLTNLKSLNFLDTVKNDLVNFKGLQFKTVESEEIAVHSQRISLNSSLENNKQFITYKDYTNFEQNSIYPFIGKDFFVQRSLNDSIGFAQVLSKLCILFSLTSTFDITRIHEGILHYELKGYKFLRGQILVTKLNKKLDIYLKINNWIYSDSTNIADKIGLARNILSLNIDEKTLKVDANTFESILSAHKIYLKENVTKYLDIRYKLNQELDSIIKDAKESLKELKDNYQRSNFIFISYFVSVYILRTLNKSNFENVFTKDATYIFFGLVIISIIYLFYTLWVVRSEKGRIKNRYHIVKERNEDLLTKTDINKILNNDNEFNDELAYFNNRVLSYVVIWIITMFVLSVIVLELSNQLNVIKEFIYKFYYLYHNYTW